MRLENRTLDDMLSLHLNDVIIKEIYSKELFNKAMESISIYIDNLKYKTGRKVRYERREGMKKVLYMLYSYLNLETGECSPSMRSIAIQMQPELELPYDIDSPEIKTEKEKAIAPALMFIQRSIKALKDFGIIITHEYRANTNRNDDPNNPNLKNPNFYYELTPISIICEEFAEFLKKASVVILTTVGKVSKSIKEFFQKINMLMHKITYPRTYTTTELLASIQT
jgi:hypothetical protein